MKKLVKLLNDLESIGLSEQSSILRESINSITMALDKVEANIGEEIILKAQEKKYDEIAKLDTLKSELNEYTKKKEKAVTEIGVRVKNYAYPGVLIRVDDKQLALTDIVCEVFFRRQNAKIAMFSLDDEENG